VAAAPPQLAECNLGKANQAGSHAVHARALYREGLGNGSQGLAHQQAQRGSCKTMAIVSPARARRVLTWASKLALPVFKEQLAPQQLD